MESRYKGKEEKSNIYIERYLFLTRLRPTEILEAIYVTTHTRLFLIMINCSFRRPEEQDNWNPGLPDLLDMYQKAFC